MGSVLFWSHSISCTMSPEQSKTLYNFDVHFNSLCCSFTFFLRANNGSLIGSCDREKGNDHRDKIFGPRIHFFIVFFIFLQTFFCQGQFFLQIFFAAQFFSFFREETNKFWCPEGGYNIVFVPKVELCCPAGEFLS